MITDLGENFLKIIKRFKDSKPVEIAHVQEHLTMTKTELQTFCDAIGGMTEHERSKFVAMLKPMLVDKPDGSDITKGTDVDVGITLYSKYFKALRGKAIQDEEHAFMSSFYHASKKYIEILTKLEAELAEYIEAKQLNVHNTKLTHMIIMGFLNDASILAQTQMFMLNLVTVDVTKEIEKPAPYRAKFVAEHLNDIIKVVNDVYMEQGPMNFMASLTDVKKTKDVIVSDGDNGVNTAFINTDDLPVNAKGYVHAMFKIPNFFQWLGEWWNLFQNARYRKIEHEREWMAKHVALLKMKLSNADPNGPDYQRSVKIIESYDALITEADKKISQYYKE
jgi:hypothetical protein